MAAIVQSFPHAATGTVSHLVSDSATRCAAIIDPVLDFDLASGRISSEHAQCMLDHARSHGLRVAWILETHAHADHLSAADWLKRQLTNGDEAVRIGIGAGIIAVQRHFREVFGFGEEFVSDGSQFDRLFSDNDEIALGESRLRVIATPGHTGDGVSYVTGDAVFVGDTLFAPQSGTGRCDFPGADAATQYRSIRRLYELPDATRVFLCHDYPASGAEPTCETTIGAEKSGNVQLNAATSEADYVAFRTRRDVTLAAPRLLYPSLQVNICAGRLPPPDANGRRFLRVPIRDDSP
jgi:glyoxylase-like metal-dependent hydrolase (beta-lactamase superfamily II)